MGRYGWRYNIALALLYRKKNKIKGKNERKEAIKEMKQAKESHRPGRNEETKPLKSSKSPQNKWPKGLKLLLIKFAYKYKYYFLTIKTLI